ncbi:LexA family transcriptional regulator [Vibrio crassostreae]|uniref:LexA family transcriptional regulator n=2 Tax=Vibrio crassostreae TaxID=246167 RepID=UPI0010492E28|nr:LexA family transcriptional regulator [Vibrio crassostreae]TCU01664.1 phage repressor protein C with HTH and peptisase S24 domain [Vibrio crassostreae]
MNDVDKQIEELKKLTKTSKNTELAAALGIARNTVQMWRIRGKIPERIFLKAQHIAEDSTNPPIRSNVSKIVPMSEFKAWSELPVYDVHAAAGAGTLVQGEFQLDTLMVPTSLLSEFDLCEKSASIIYVDGDSMEPTLSDKDRLLVDTRELQHPVPNGVYVIRIDDAVYVKRLKWNIAKGVYLIVSDNQDYEAFEINHKTGRNFKIIGKAIAPVFKKIF